MQFQTALISDKGGRNVNQDFAAYCESDHGGCWALADGLGGYQSGEVAAKLAVETILQEYKHNSCSNWIKEGIEKTQTIIHQQQKSGINKRSMRTTIVILTFENDKACWAHVGDSRVYHIREGRVIAQTKDHSVCQALVNAGEITPELIRFHEDRNRLYRVLGSDGAVKATILNDEVSIQQGDAFLLCSDGFWEYVTEIEMENTRISASTPFEWLQKMEAILNERILEGNDNYSALAVFVSS
ncbi:protein phosphatase 2C domain-containing protein [Bacillus sp. FJAT-29790]|uniref:PP2C family protein-serine/threonine phosphatase n=1 Tax=Bacillus sp. FJAT-29790 TaxID=1895002 RepID=UPI001C2221FF|nr:protein phosphatase 2C domain-containing protein [Bacillus sp. FJAT-29790]MBU8878506.1 protein phosphatase 2C domain-containing protein [Bacillus sp. FJAT-29790]